MVVALAFPIAATAKSGHFVIPAGHATEFHLKASNGYTIAVYANHGQVSLVARRGNEASVIYIAHGLTSSKRIKGSFGTLGSVSVQFHPSKPPKLVPLPEGNCRGRGEIVDAGTFVGTIRFEGEQAYTAVNASRAQGKEVRAFKQTCSEEASKGGGHPSLRVTFLTASSESEHTVLSAFRTTSKSHPGFDSSAFSASILESTRGLSIFRSVSASASLDAFTATESSAGTTSTTIAPPAPFTGTATYLKAKGSPASWTGSLSTSFPGVGVVPLTGSDWMAELNPRHSGGSAGSIEVIWSRKAARKLAGSP